MSKVSAVENIIRELHGPVNAMLSLCGTAKPEEGATASVVYANAKKKFYSHQMESLSSFARNRVLPS